MKPIYFASPDELRAWLESHHETESELVVGFYKAHTGKATLTYQQMLDEALCLGWIDGVRKGVDERRYTIRLTPRKARSHWSNINVARMRELVAEGRVAPAGLRAFEARDEENTGRFSYENKPKALAPHYAKQLRANAEAAKYFDAQPQSYRRDAIYWVMTAKREETRLKRLELLIEVSARGQWLPQKRWATSAHRPRA